VTKISASGARSTALLGRKDAGVAGTFWTGKEVALVQHFFPIESFNPMAPGAPSVVASFGNVDLYWDPPENFGGQRTRYLITAIPLGFGPVIRYETDFVESVKCSTTIEGLKGQYRFTIQALNATGKGPTTRSSRTVAVGTQ
jgi:hypothetical protein